jgi:uncharacterized membrane protein YkoI
MKLLTAFLVAALAAASASASDHDRARRAVEEGRILPLKEILARAQGAYPGQMIEAELEDEGGIVVYEIKILTTNNRVMKLSYNAATGELLKTKDRNGRR